MRQIASFKVWLYSYGWLSFSAVSVFFSATLTFSLPIHGYIFFPALWVLCGTWTVYVYYFYVKLSPPFYTAKQYWFKKNSYRLHVLSLIIRGLVFGLTVVFCWLIWYSAFAFFLYGWMVLVFVFLCFYNATKRYNIRSVFWLKPFIIGFCWSSMWALSLIFYIFINSCPAVEFISHNFLLHFVYECINNFVFISLVSIIYDIKDSRLDKKQGLRTLALVIGKGRLIQNILLPFLILYALLILIFGFKNNFSFFWIIGQIMPYCFIFALSLRIKKRPQSFDFYLVYVDGLIFLKAIFGLFSLF